jgi:intracellular sulfur oxidation DsrE/DsrF family protein
MHRRSILWGAVSALGALASSRAGSEAPSPPTKLKAVYRLSDLEKVSFVLGNIQNHFDGVGGPAHVTIALVIHGPAPRAFHSASANPDLSRRVEQFSGDGVELAACGNTMKSQISA